MLFWFSIILSGVAISLVKAGQGFSGLGRKNSRQDICCSHIEIATKGDCAYLYQRVMKIEGLFEGTARPRQAPQQEGEAEA